MEEDEILSADQAITEVSILDSQIIEARNAKDKTNEEKLEEISNLMEQRNALVDKLQKAKQAEFKEFVESLNLKEIKCSPFFPVGRKCRISTNDPDAELVEKPPEFEKSFFRKNKNPKANSNPITVENYEFCAKRLKDVESKLEIYKKKKILSPQDRARKFRLEAEKGELVKFLEQ